VRVATTANLTASYSSNVLTNTGALATLVVDGITLANNDRILVKNQTTASQNGIYQVTNAGSASVAWVLTRAASANATTEIAGGAVAVDSGTTNGGDLWTTTFKSTDTLGTTSMIWNEVVDSGNIGNWAPTKTGSGASGSWGISVTGTAANVTGTVAIANGGTGATTVEAAASNLGVSKINPSAAKAGDVQVSSGVISMYDGTAWKQVFPAVYA
jgi:hypothetical protein